MKKTLIVAAPFGYGPAAKAIHIAEHLAGRTDVTIVSAGDAYRLIRKYTDPSVTCLSGTFQSVFETYQLASHDVFISINNAPAVTYLADSGYQYRTVFIDSLLPWRVQNDPANWQLPIQAYLVEDFPGSEVFLSHCLAERVELVAPGFCRRVYREPGTERGNITLALGGITSPLVTWEAAGIPVARIIEGVMDLSRQYGTPVTIIGSEHLRRFLDRENQDVEIMSAISPAQASKAISESGFIITTPGLGSVHQGIACDVPVLLLPPMNSTQLFHSRVFHRHKMPMTLASGPAVELFELSDIPSWHQQTRACIDWLHANQTILLPELPGLMSILLSGDEHDREMLMSAQIQFAGSLNRTDPLTVIDMVI